MNFVPRRDGNVIDYSFLRLDAASDVPAGAVGTPG